jgi:hypothetical protein
MGTALDMQAGDQFMYHRKKEKGDQAQSNRMCNSAVFYGPPHRPYRLFCDSTHLLFIPDDCPRIQDLG